MARGKHKGIQQYTVQESNNLLLGQLGFDKVTQAGGIKTGNWVAIYNPDSSAISVTVVTSVGEDVTTTIVSGTYLYGPFTAITIGTSAKHAIAYRG